MTHPQLTATTQELGQVFEVGGGASKKVAVVLPAYNEEQTIEQTIRDFWKAIPNAAIWVVNNRSNDATERLARETLSILGCAGGVINEMRPGKGSAVRRAFMDIDADIYVLADADSTYPAEELAAKPTWWSATATAEDIMLQRTRGFFMGSGIAW